MIDGFISITTLPTFDILLRLIYSCFNIVDFYDVILCCYQKWFCFSLKVSLSQLCPRLFVWDFVCLSLELFSFPFLFSAYFCSVDDCVVCIVFHGSNQSSSGLVYVVVGSLCRCIDASTLSWILPSPPPRSFLGIYSLSMSSLESKVLCIIINFLVLWSTSKIFPSILQGEQARC